jgi:hypothetical protein
VIVAGTTKPSAICSVCGCDQVRTLNRPLAEHALQRTPTGCHLARTARVPMCRQPELISSQSNGSGRSGPLQLTVRRRFSRRAQNGWLWPNSTPHRLRTLARSRKWVVIVVGTHQADGIDLGHDGVAGSSLLNPTW